MSKPESQIKFAILAVDVVLFRMFEGKLGFLTVRSMGEDSKARFALPGGLVKPEEDLEAATARYAIDHLGPRPLSLEQVSTFGRVDRDPTGRVVSVCFMALLTGEDFEEYGASGVSQWRDAKRPPTLAYDHAEMLAAAIAKLRMQVRYSSAIRELLPQVFSLSEMQEVYEAVIGEKQDRRNFRKRALSVYGIKPAGITRSGQRGKSPALYRFTGGRAWI